MRKTVMIMAVLALAGCDAGNSQPPAREKAQPAAQAPAVSAPQWFIQMNSREAVSDISAWLLERGYAPVVVTIEGKQQLLIGPYQDQAQAEEQLTGLKAKVAKSHRFAEPGIIQRNP
ncbi:SPOR domain-containing protein [Pseudomonas sp. NPDC089734]|uniref:SPOR domain-containing protein n=1 Tax=Pseudomonas sp. NPDC089734 TaxID=3364469 RepID=UPI0038027FDF